MFRIIFLILIVLDCSTCDADTWAYPKENKVEEFHFGSIKIVRRIDSTKNQQYPYFSVEMYEQDKLVAKYPGLSFQTLKSDKYNKVFVGLSNSGLPGTAVFILHSTGYMSMLVRHDFFQPDYCDRSVTLVRVWYDAKNPDIQFKYKKNTDNTENLAGITFRNCNGEKVDLMDTIIKGYQKTIDEYNSAMNTKNNKPANTP